LILLIDRGKKEKKGNFGVFSVRPVLLLLFSLFGHDFSPYFVVDSRIRVESFCQFIGDENLAIFLAVKPLYSNNVKQ